jgi:hypothetical protein
MHVSEQHCRAYVALLTQTSRTGEISGRIATVGSPAFDRVRIGAGRSGEHEQHHDASGSFVGTGEAIRAAA